jgi:hypothetical protein
MYEYTSVTVSFKTGFKVQPGDTFDDCMEVIHNYAKDGWRLVQIIALVNEKSWSRAQENLECYEIIFEKQVNDKVNDK